MNSCVSRGKGKADHPINPLLRLLQPSEAAEVNKTPGERGRNPFGMCKEDPCEDTADNREGDDPIPTSYKEEGKHEQAVHSPFIRSRGDFGGYILVIYHITRI